MTYIIPGAWKFIIQAMGVNQSDDECALIRQWLGFNHMMGVI